MGCPSLVLIGNCKSEYCNFGIRYKATRFPGAGVTHGFIVDFYREWFDTYKPYLYWLGMRIDYWRRD